MERGIVSAVKKVQFVSDRMSYIILRGRWCHIIVLNVHSPTEDKTDDVKDRHYEELGRVLDKFPKYHMKILLDFNAEIIDHQCGIQSKISLVLYVCETWCRTLGGGLHRLGVFENRVLTIILGPKRDEVTGEWRKLHSEELRQL
jgi:hypothetical protein